MNKIPRPSAWCSRCVCGDCPCDDHRDENGQARDYSGPGAYDPSAWILEVVGKRYRTLSGICVCFGYDPRNGFWMRDVATGKARNVSERAIGKTCHEVRMTPGAERMLVMCHLLGRVPTANELTEANIMADYAPQTLTDLGLLDGDTLTEEGKVAAAQAAKEHVARLT